MIRIAHERIGDLFAAAAVESRGPHPELAHRYVRLARRIGMRYNVRLPVEYRELYCRACSSFWSEGVTVRTRLRQGRRVRTCLLCGATRRARIRAAPRLSERPPSGEFRVAPQSAAVLSEAPSGPGDADQESEEEE
ncbi:MAG: ribonuclease P [Thermoplasmata archaeon]|nr:ribonuclease P [Thermoplasmata archaeon]